MLSTMLVFQLQGIFVCLYVFTSESTQNRDFCHPDFSHYSANL